MTAPSWINAAIRDFGRAAGIDGFALNERGTAALRFDTGVSLRLEYTVGELAMAMTVPRPADLKRLLSLSHPKSRLGFKVRAGLLRKTGEAVIAIRLAERDATLPRLNAAFAVLWRFAGEIGGATWA